MISIQSESFSVEHISNKIRADNNNIGAVVTFVGYVRDFEKNDGKTLSSMELEHYPGMTEKVLEDIEKKALKKWKLSAIDIVHLSLIHI